MNLPENHSNQHTDDTPWLFISTWLKRLLAAITVGIIIWSLIWVGMRPFRMANSLGDRVEITVMHWGSRDTDQIYQRLVRSFEEKNPHIKIKRINVPTFYNPKIQTQYVAGDPPDVMLLLHQYAISLAGKGLLMSLDSSIVADEQSGVGEFQRKDFYPEVLNGFRFDGKVSGQGSLYGIPTGFTTFGFYYNKDLFDSAGVAYPTDDWSWDEFEEKAKAIGQLEGVYGCELYRFIENIQAILWTFGSDLYTSDMTSVQVDDPMFITVMNRLRSWRFDYPGMLTKPQNPLTAEGAFVAGKIGMLGPAGRWVTVNFRRIKNFNWEFVQLPRGTNKANMFTSAAWCIAKNTKHPKEAWKVVQHFASPESQRFIAASGNEIPSLRTVAEGDAFLHSIHTPPKRNDLFLKPIPWSKSVKRPSDFKLISMTDTAISEALTYGTKTVVDAFGQLRQRLKREARSPLVNTDYSPMPWFLILFLLSIAVFFLTLFGIFHWWKNKPKGAVLLEELVGLGMLSPWVIGFLVFTAIPLIISLLLVFTKWSGIHTLDKAQLVGMGNFIHMFQYDERFWKSLWVTVYYVILHVPLGQVAALAVAMLMNNQVKGINFYRSAWYLPSVLTGVGVAVLWVWIFNDQDGLLNRVLDPILGLVGLNAPDWLGRDAEIFGVPAFVIMSLWSIGGGMLIYLAGLSAISPTYYEAAKVDGAGWWRRFWHITVPMLSPVILFNSVIAIIGSFQIFTQSYIMTGGTGGVSDSALFYVLYLYLQAFTYHEMGYASAMAWMLFMIVLVLTILFLRMSRRFVHYEGMRM